MGAQNANVVGAPAVTVGLGWLEATYWVPDAFDAFDRFREVVDLDLVPAGSDRFYSRVWTGGSGVRAGVSRQDAQQFHFQLKQTAGEHLGAVKLERLALWSDEVRKRKFSRVDLAVNDARRIVEPEQIRAAILARDFVGRAHRFRWVDDLNGSHSLYVGSPSSRQQLRIYDKDREQGVPIGTYGIRWENQCRNEAGNDVVERMYSLGRCAGQTRAPGEIMWAVTSRLIDFREQASSSHPERRRRLDWFSELAGSTVKADLAHEVSIDRAAALAAWLEHSVASPLAQLVDDARYGEAWLDQLLELGRRRLGEQEARAGMAELRRRVRRSA